jgi:putative transposase
MMVVGMLCGTTPARRALCAKWRHGGERRSAVRKARGERGIWQRRFWEHLIRDDADYARHVEYCYFNPIKHGHARRARDWPHSSFHRDVRHGLFPLDWAGEVALNGAFGERGP